MAATVPSIQIKKTMPFKGGSRVVSNRYAFTGGTPADLAHWTTLANAVVTAEKALHPSTVQIIEAIGYAAGSDVPVASISYTTNGTYVIGGRQAPGEVAALIRWSTAARSTKNHPIYAFSYFHNVDLSSSAGAIDVVAGTFRTALQTFASSWVSGFSDGANTYVRSTPKGHTATGQYVDQYVTHRDFPYTPST